MKEVTSIEKKQGKYLVRYLVGRSYKIREFETITKAIHYTLTFDLPREEVLSLISL